MSTSLITSEWSHPRTGQVRRYLDPQQVWDLVAGPDTKIADMNRVLSAKYWLDEAGGLHIERLIERGRTVEADIRTAIEAALAADAEEAPVDDETAEPTTDTTKIVEATATDGTPGFSVLYPDGTPTATWKGLPLVYTDRAYAERAAELIEAGEIGDRAHAATRRTPCQHGDYDCNGRCYSCGRVVVRGVGSYL